MLHVGTDSRPQDWYVFHATFAPACGVPSGGVDRVCVVFSAQAMCAHFKPSAVTHAWRGVFVAEICGCVFNVKRTPHCDASPRNSRLGGLSACGFLLNRQRQAWVSVRYSVNPCFMAMCLHMYTPPNNLACPGSLLNLCFVGKFSQNSVYECLKPSSSRPFLCVCVRVRTEVNQPIHFPLV